MKRVKKKAAKKPAPKQRKRAAPPTPEVPYVAHYPRPALLDQTRTVAPLNGFATTRKVTLPELWCRIDVPVLVQPLEHIRADTGIATDTTARKRPAGLMRVADLGEGCETKDLAVVAGLWSLLDASYPERAYVGKFFRITRHRRHERKNQWNYSVEEINPESRAV